MSRASRRDAGVGAEDGSAVVEFVFLAVLLLVPLIYLTMMIARVQAGSYAVAQAAREAGRAFVTAESDQSASGRAQAAARIAFEDQGFPGGDGTVAIACAASPCLTPDATVTFTATVTVPLPLIPSFARDVIPLEIPVTSVHALTIDRFREGLG
ncbi:pilus assembly protein [Nostocoides veronense]|uniref:TadE family protein n=1 Tax=Nostocoides veronense TaxID=330836 RepID=A0ABN2LC07_9MICO